MEQVIKDVMVFGSILSCAFVFMCLVLLFMPRIGGSDDRPKYRPMLPDGWEWDGKEWVRSDWRRSLFEKKLKGELDPPDWEETKRKILGDKYE